MIEISVDDVVSERLEALPGVLERARRKAAFAMAESYVEDTLDWIALGKSFISRTGQLEQSINWEPSGDGARVFAGAEHAPHVEFGTRAHVIRPKPGRKALRFFIGGNAVIRKSVQHPGTDPQPFFFADQSRRKQSMLEKARLVIGEEIGIDG